mgnify:CR=1 FL=1
MRQLSPVLLEALKSALSKYNTYLASFGDEEFYLKKKVEVELGSLLTHIKQRCSGLGPEWGNVIFFLPCIISIYVVPNV